MITFTGSPEVGWGIRAQAPPQEGRARARQQRAGDHRARRRLRDRGQEDLGRRASATPGSRASRRNACYVHESIAESSSASSSPLVEALEVGDPLDEATDVSALISTGERDRVASMGRGGAAAGRDGRVPAARSTRRRARADGAHRRHARHEGVHAARCSVRWSASRPTATTTKRCASRTTPATACRPRSSRSELDAALRAAQTLDFGGVLVNEVPTFRADQQPYGGLRDSGNTREGPRYAVEEMTEARLVILSL